MHLNEVDVQEIDDDTYQVCLFRAATEGGKRDWAGSPCVSSAPLCAPPRVPSALAVCNKPCPARRAHAPCAAICQRRKSTSKAPPPARSRVCVEGDGTWRALLQSSPVSPELSSSQVSAELSVSPPPPFPHALSPPPLTRASRRGSSTFSGSDSTSTSRTGSCSSSSSTTKPQATSWSIRLKSSGSRARICATPRTCRSSLLASRCEPMRPLCLCARLV